MGREQDDEILKITAYALIITVSIICLVIVSCLFCPFCYLAKWWSKRMDTLVVESIATHRHSLAVHRASRNGTQIRIVPRTSAVRPTVHRSTIGVMASRTNRESDASQNIYSFDPVANRGSRSRVVSMPADFDDPNWVIMGLDIDRNNSNRNG